MIMPIALDTRIIYKAHCTIIRDLSVDEYERIYEIAIYPHHEMDDDPFAECSAYAEGLQLLGPWAEFTAPLDTVTDLRTGVIVFLLTPLD